MELEDQMCDYVPGQGKRSPDRMDALVWAVTHLLPLVPLSMPAMMRVPSL